MMGPTTVGRRRKDTRTPAQLRRQAEEGCLRMPEGYSRHVWAYAFLASAVQADDIYHTNAQLRAISEGLDRALKGGS